MDRLTDEQIKELKKLEKEATPGPWDAVDQGGRFNTGAIRRNREDLIGKLDTLRDASLTVALRNAAPALLDEVEETRRQAEDRRRNNEIFEKLAPPDGCSGCHRKDLDLAQDGTAWRCAGCSIKGLRAASALLAALESVLALVQEQPIDWKDAIPTARAAIALAREAGIKVP